MDSPFFSVREQIRAIEYIEPPRSVLSLSLKGVFILCVDGASNQTASPWSPALHGKSISHPQSVNRHERECTSDSDLCSACLSNAEAVRTETEID